MEHDAADELNVVMHHVPGDFVAAGEPVVLPEGFVAFDADEVAALGGELAVEVGGCNLHGLVFGEAAGGLAHCGEYYGKVLVELVFKDVEHIFFMLVDFLPERLALVEGEIFHARADFGGCILVGFYGLGYFGAHGVDLTAELVVGKVVERGAYGVDFVYNGFDLFEVAGRLVAKEFRKYRLK